MNRYRITMREVKHVIYEIDAYNIDCALQASHNWALQESIVDAEEDTILKIELIYEEKGK